MTPNSKLATLMIAACCLSGLIGMIWPGLFMAMICLSAACTAILVIWQGVEE